MKKILSCALLCFTLFLSSCGRGVSVSYMQIRGANDPAAVLLSQTVCDGYQEILKYYNPDGSESYSYSVYIESSDKIAYNVLEISDNYALSAYNGELYAEKNGELFVILQASGTYTDYVNKYMTFDCGFDKSLQFYQLYSEKLTINSKEMTKVAYYADVTPAFAAAYSDENITLGDKIVAEYLIYKNYTAKSINYYLRKSGSEDRLLLNRSFEYFNDKQNVFSSLPSLDEAINVSIVFYPGAENEYTAQYRIPSGYKIGIDTAGKDISFFCDSEMTQPFDYSSEVAYDGMKIYAVYN